MQVFPSVKGLRGIPPVGGVGMRNFVEGRLFFFGWWEFGWVRGSHQSPSRENVDMAT